MKMIHMTAIVRMKFFLIDWWWWKMIDWLIFGRKVIAPMSFFWFMIHRKAIAPTRFFSLIIDEIDWLIDWLIDGMVDWFLIELLCQYAREDGCSLCNPESPAVQIWKDRYEDFKCWEATLSPGEHELLAAIWILEPAVCVKPSCATFNISSFRG